MRRATPFAIALPWSFRTMWSDRSIAAAVPADVNT